MRVPARFRPGRAAGARRWARGCIALLAAPLLLVSTTPAVSAQPADAAVENPETATQRQLPSYRKSLARASIRPRVRKLRESSASWLSAPRYSKRKQNQQAPQSQQSGNQGQGAGLSSSSSSDLSQLPIPGRFGMPKPQPGSAAQSLPG